MAKIILRPERSEKNSCNIGLPIYLDHNATTQVDKRVFAKVGHCFTTVFGNPASRDHSFGWDAAEATEEARYHVADLINAVPNEIVFTSCATESINLAVKGLVQANKAKKKAIVTSAIEHEAMLGACRQVEASMDGEIKYLPVDRSGNIALDELARSIGMGKTLLVSLMFANNEIGTINPIREIARIAHESGALLFTDATQAVGKIPVDVREDGIDLAAFSAHKLYGPKGVGALFIRGGEPKIKLEPLIAGGGQERGMRGGTLNVPGIVGFGEACRIAQMEMREESERVRKLRDRLEEALLAELPDAHINGDIKNRLPNTSNIAFAGVDARTLIRDMHNIAVSTRSACSSGSQGPSHVLKALGLSDEQAYSSIRFSPGRYTTEEEIDYAIERVIGSVRKLRKHRATMEQS